MAERPVPLTVEATEQPLRQSRPRVPDSSSGSASQPITRYLKVLFSMGDDSVGAGSVGVSQLLTKLVLQNLPANGGREF